MKVSVAIPCYEMKGRGADCLNFCLETIARQTFPDVEVVVSDHSVDDAVKQVCDRWQESLDLSYIRFEQKRGSSSANINNALRHCRGDIIKILCQDDYLSDENSLASIAKCFQDSTVNWLVSSYWHTKDRQTFSGRQDPAINAEIEIKNTIGTHSCLTVRNGDIPFFDENLIWFMDCEYYRQLHDIWGLPYILPETTMVQYLWSGQVTNTSASSKFLRLREQAYVRKKHPRPIPDLPVVDDDRYKVSFLKKVFLALMT